VNPKHEKVSRNLKVAYLFLQSFTEYFLWGNAIKKAVEKYGGSCREIGFSHQDDPVISEVFKGDFDIIFIRYNLSCPSFVKDLVLRNKDRVVTLFEDLTTLGVRCFDGPPNDSIDNLVEYLYELGHRCFASYSQEPKSESNSARMNYWTQAVAGKNLPCENVVFHLEANTDIHIPAYEGADKILKRKGLLPTAVFCATVATAISLIRRCYDLGFNVGHDISVVSFAQPEMAKMHIPSITVVDRPSPEPEAEAVIRDFLEKGSQKQNRLMYRPEKAGLIIGESTGRVLQ
jgi:DNA-binding LacI/PurR family transcriptional regulator